MRRPYEPQIHTTLPRILACHNTLQLCHRGKSIPTLKKHTNLSNEFHVFGLVFLQGSKVDLSLLLPETNTSRDILRSLDLNAKVSTRDGKWRWKREENEGKWRQFCSFEDGWVDTWSAPRVSLNIEFLFHPVPLAGPPPQADVPTPEKEKKLLGPLHAPFHKSSTLQVCRFVVANSTLVAFTIPKEKNPD